MSAQFAPYQPRRRRGRTIFVVLAVVVAVVAALGIAVAGRHRSSTGPQRPIPPSATQTVPGGQPPGPEVDLSGLRWVDFHGMRLPVSATDGPRHQRGGLAWGFAATPRGALLAAMHIGVRANATFGPRIFTPTIGHQVVDTGNGATNKAALLTSSRADYDQLRRQAGVPAGQPAGRVYAVIEGFRWGTYTPREATIELLSAGPDQQNGGSVRASTRIQLTRRDGDWRVYAPVGGDWGNAATQVPKPPSRCSPTVGVSNCYTMFPGQG